MNDSVLGSIFLFSFLGIYCLILVGIFVFSALFMWLLIVCFIDVSNKTEEEFRDRTLWIILLIISFFIPFGFIIPLIYYFQYKPKMKFWEK